MRITGAPGELTAVRSRRGGLILAGTLIFCVLVLSAQAPAHNRRGSLLQSWILSAAAPVASVGSLLSRAASEGADSVDDLFTTRAENARLKKEILQKDRELFRLRAGGLRGNEDRDGWRRRAPRCLALFSRRPSCCSRAGGAFTALWWARARQTAWAKARRSRWPKASSGAS